MFFISPLLSLNYFLHYGNAEYKYIKKNNAGGLRDPGGGWLNSYEKRQVMAVA